MIKTSEIIYQDNGIMCHGFLAFDDNASLPLPGVMVAHDWHGRGEAACDKAKQLAKLGYAGFAIDMYGEAQLGHDKTECRALMTPFMEDRKKLVNRIAAAFTTFTQLPQVDNKRIAAIGYCFGGLCVLDLARSGIDIKGVVSFHGLLSAPPDTSDKPQQAKVLVLHGFDDPLILPVEVNNFALEMTAKKVDWQVHMYGLTSHSFTDPKADDDELGLHYNKKADQRSWKSMLLFLQEVLDTQ